MLRNGLLQPAISRLPSPSFSAGVVMNGISKAASNPFLHQFSRSVLSSKLFGDNLQLPNKACFKGALSASWVGSRAVLAEDPAVCEVTEVFDLDAQSQLQVNFTNSTGESPLRINLQVTNSSPSLILHWGACRYGEKKWILPSQCPKGTKNYKNRALRTPFTKSGEKSFLMIEIHDSNIPAIEFILYDESTEKWFKYKGQNFHIDLPRSKSGIKEISIPEDLVQVQAYLRWERKGKQMYSPEKEKEEYEATRKELQDKVAKGVSINEIRAKQKGGASLVEYSSSEEIPEDFVQIQSYIRWERAGKPNYSKERQLQEFEAARKELEDELSKGVSLADLLKKLRTGDVQTTAADTITTYTTPQRIQRKKRDVMQILNKFPEIKGNCCIKNTQVLAGYGRVGW